MPDSIILMTLIFAVSLFALMKGADWLIEGSSAFARHFNVSELIIGLTIVAFGTSLPEFVVSIQSAWQGSGGLAYANAVGSNIANILLVVGAAAIVLPLKTSEDIRQDLRFFMALVVVFAMIVFFGRVNVVETFLFRSKIHTIGGLVLLTFFLLFIFRIFKKNRLDQLAPQPVNDGVESSSLFKASILLVFGLALVIGGGDFTVNSAVAIAKRLGVPETTIGLTIVAFGTSLPEFVASLVAAGKGKGDLIIGNILGSNFMNLAFVLGSAATFFPISISTWGVADMLVHTVVSMTFLLLMARRTSGFNLGRQTGIIFILLYLLLMTLVGFRETMT